VIIDDRADNEPRSLPEAAPANRWKMGTADISDVIAALKQWLDARAPRHRSQVTPLTALPSADFMLASFTRELGGCGDVAEHPPEYHAVERRHGSPVRVSGESAWLEQACVAHSMPLTPRGLHGRRSLTSTRCTEGRLRRARVPA
jgi:hypothetical protein